jgi:SAM-dependent methyltransferase
MGELAYTPLEKLVVARPVERIAFIRDRCAGQSVLDLGCFDETAQSKRETTYWLHGAIAEVAGSVVGVDCSPALPVGGIETGPHSRILPGDVMKLGETLPADTTFDVIVAGELVEHVADAQGFFAMLKGQFPGRELIVSTPNATSLSNVLLGMSGRESNHPDHTQIYSYKTLNTLCRRAGFDDWQIIPYYVRYTEMMLSASSSRRVVVRAAERAVNLAEAAFPMLAGGLILHVTRV